MSKTGVMEIAFSHGTITADAKKGMVNLKDIEQMGMRIDGVLEVNNYGKRLNRWLESEDTKAFINELEKKNHSNNNIQEIYTLTGRGRNSKAFGHLYLALKYAMYVNKQLEVEVLEVFIEKQILDSRICGIESFKELNCKIDKLTDVQNSNRKSKFYISIATAINIRCNGKFIPEWDHVNANADKQKLRREILDNSIYAINNGLIQTYQELKKSIENHISRISN